MSPTKQDLSNDTTFSQIKSCVPVPLNPGDNSLKGELSNAYSLTPCGRFHSFGLVPSIIVYIALTLVCTLYILF